MCPTALRCAATQSEERPPFVWVWPGNPALSRGTEPPDLPALRESGWTILGGSLEMAVNYMLLA